MRLALRSVFLVVLAVFILKVSAFTSSKVISNVASRAARHVRHNNLSLNRFMGNSNTAMSALRDEINADISGNDVVIYSKTYCPYCTRAKAAVQAQGVNFKVIELDNVANGADIQAELLALTGQKTVPNVFVKGKHLGGCDNTLAAISDGKFRTMLSA